jgi:hypothetical protein
MSHEMSDYDETMDHGHGDWGGEQSLLTNTGDDMNGEPYGTTALFTDGTAVGVLDADDDGYADKVVYDDNGDGEADRAFTDQNHNDVLETEYIDSNHDGKADIIVGDRNEDGFVDYYARDTDFDGDIDVVVQN